MLIVRLILVALGKCHVLIWFAFIFIFWDHCWFLIRKWCIPAMYLFIFHFHDQSCVYMALQGNWQERNGQLLLESCFQTVIYRTRGLFRQNWGCRYYRYRHDPDVVLGKLHCMRLLNSIISNISHHMSRNVFICPFGFINIVSKILLEIYIVPLISLS